jgi:hypothetical protein
MGIPYFYNLKQLLFFWMLLYFNVNLLEYTALFFLKKKKGSRKDSNPKFGKGGCQLYQCQGKNVPERCSGLHPSEKELPGRQHSSVSHHKNTPESTYTLLAAFVRYIECCHTWQLNIIYSYQSQKSNRCATWGICMQFSQYMYLYITYKVTDLRTLRCSYISATGNKRLGCQKCGHFNLAISWWCSDTCRTVVCYCPINSKCRTSVPP